MLSQRAGKVSGAIFTLMRIPKRFASVQDSADDRPRSEIYGIGGG